MAETKRVEKEKTYWNNFAIDPMVDLKYISDIEREPFLELIGDLCGKVLDVGCGVGRLMKNGYCGIDISQNMLDIAETRMPDCEFKLCDGRTIPYQDQYFDNVQCILVFQHLPFEGVQSYIREISRVLKTGGHFVFQFIDQLDKGSMGELSSAHSTADITMTLNENWLIVEKLSKGEIHPQWTWIKAIKK